MNRETNGRITTSTLKIQNIQNLIIDIPTGYVRKFMISSSEFQKMCKDMGSLGNTIVVTTSSRSIKFECGVSGILDRTVKFEKDVDIP